MQSLPIGKEFREGVTKLMELEYETMVSLTVDQRTSFSFGSWRNDLRVFRRPF